MRNENLRDRTKKFALQVIKFVETFPKERTADIIGRQLIRSGTSVGANYRAACRARSPADFIAKMGIVEEEADESIYWLEMLADTNLVSKEDYLKLTDEANQILSIVVASIKTARANKEKYSHEPKSSVQYAKSGDQ